MGRLKVLSCFLCILMILTQLISALALDGVPSEPADKGIVQTGGEEVCIDEVEKPDEGEPSGLREHDDMKLSDPEEPVKSGEVDKPDEGKSDNGAAEDSEELSNTVEFGEG